MLLTLLIHSIKSFQRSMFVLLNYFFFLNYGYNSNIISSSSPYLLFYWPMSYPSFFCLSLAVSFIFLIKELFFTADHTHWCLNHFWVYHILLKVKVPQQPAVFKILLLLNEITVSPLISIFSLVVNILFAFLTGLTSHRTNHKDVRSVSSGVMVNLEWLCV